MSCGRRSRVMGEDAEDGGVAAGVVWVAMGLGEAMQGS